MPSLLLDSIQSNKIRILHEDLYFNFTSIKSVHRIYFFIFHHHQELDGRCSSSLILPSRQFNSVQIPLNYISNQTPKDLIRQRDIQQITFLGKINRLSVERILRDYWQHPAKQGLTNVKVLIIQLQKYLAYSSK